MTTQAVVVTGISGNLGRTLAKLLHKKYRILGIDRRTLYRKIRRYGIKLNEM